MKKEKMMLLLALCIGMVLMSYSWFLSYPLSIDSPSDFLFNHISPVHWLGLPILLGALYVLAIRLNNYHLKWIILLGIFMSMYSLSYFYYMLPGQDSHYFRGLTEYFVTTKDMDPLKPYHEYFDFPLFFILNQVATSVLGIEIMAFEFVLYAIIGFLYVTCLYIYFSRVDRDGGHIAEVAFFILTYYFLIYQCAPVSLAVGLLLVLLMIETLTHVASERSGTFLKLVVFVSMALMHPFMCVFYILYIFLMYVINRNEGYLRLFLLTLTTYLVIILFFTKRAFLNFVEIFAQMHSIEYGLLAQLTLAGPATPLDAIAQTISRAVTITVAVISGVGFVILLRKRKIRHVDYAIFFSGAISLAVGAVVPAVGGRAFPIAAIPMSLGASYFWKGRFRSFLKCLFLIFLVLFTFIAIHSSYANSQLITFQTREEYQSTNFLIYHYDWTKPGLMLVQSRVKPYLQVKSCSERVDFKSDWPWFYPQWAEGFDCILYTVSLGKSLSKYNSSFERILFEGKTKFGIVFNSGFSYILIRVPQNSSAPK